MARFEIPDGWMSQSYRYALDPTPKQVRALESHCGAARFAFNHMLALVKAVTEQRAAERSYGLGDGELTPAVGWSLPALRRIWNQRKFDCAPWWPDNSKEAYNSGLDGLARGLDAWTRSRSGDRAGPRIGFPRFKSRHRAGKSVRFTTGAIRVEPDRHHVRLPVLGVIKTHESTRKLARRVQAGTARILSVTVKYEGGRWFCAFAVLVHGKQQAISAARSRSGCPVVGVDVGVKDLLVVAAPTGIELARIPAPKPLTDARARLRTLQRRAARRYGPFDPVIRTRRAPSNRWRRTRTQIGTTHARVANLRREALHTATTALVGEHATIVIENLNVAGMSRRGGAGKRGLNRVIADAGLSTIASMLGYKPAWNQGTLISADRWFASTRTCSRCQAKTKLALGDRVYRCVNGCPPIDRDLNAAINLARLGDPTHCPGRGMGTGTGSGPAASSMAGEGRGVTCKTDPAHRVGSAGGAEASTPHHRQVGRTGTASPQGEAV